MCFTKRKREEDVCTLRGSESSTGGSSFVVSADDGGTGAAEKSLDSRSKAALSSKDFCRTNRESESCCVHEHSIFKYHFISLSYCLIVIYTYLFGYFGGFFLGIFHFL